MPIDPSNGSPSPEATDRVARIRAAVVENHERLLHSIALMIAKTEHRPCSCPDVMDQAQDVLGEAVQEALGHAENFDPSRSAVAWLRGIAANVFRSRRRADARTHRCVPATDLGVEGWESALARLCTAPTNDAVAHRQEVEQALARITDDERHVIVLRYYHGLGGEKLAKVLGVPSPGAVRLRLYRAMQAFKRHFPRAEGEDHS
jgi:RNA polymerase sigma factor (sigma-70 family)